MKTISVVKAFNLILANEVKRFEVGIHKVEDEIAKHWYVIAHTQKEEATAEEPQAEDTKEDTKEEPKEEAAEEVQKKSATKAK